jgi:hypothetical protein
MDMWREVDEKIIAGVMGMEARGEMNARASHLRFFIF